MKKIFLAAFAAAMSVCAMADEVTKTITLPDGTTREVKPVATLKVTVDCETERTFGFGTYFESDYYAVDFGDGELVVTDEIGTRNTTASKTAVSGVAKGEGNITVYANDSIWYFSSSAGMSTTSPVTAMDLSGLKCVHQMSVSGLQMATVDFSKCDSLRVFTSQNGALETLDFSNNAVLNNVNLMNNKLASINVRNNPLLDQLNVNSNELTTLDLSQNPKLANLFASDNKLEAVWFAEGEDLAKIGSLYIKNNQLTALAIYADMGTFEADGNRLSSLRIKDCTKSCKIENNCFTIGIMPVKPAGLNTASKIKKFTYAPQAPLPLDENYDGTLDLSGELYAVGELEEGVGTTVFSFVDSEDNELVEGTDYTMNNGVAKFLKPFTGIHGVMTNEALPKATGANAFTTMAFNTTADAEATRINAVGGNVKAGEVFNMQGVKLNAPAKGINISEGKKVYVK